MTFLMVNGYRLLVIEGYCILVIGYAVRRLMVNRGYIDVIHRLFIVCSSFIHRSFIVCSSFIHRSFIALVVIIVLDEIELAAIAFGGAAEAVRAELLSFEGLHAVVLGLRGEVSAVIRD